MRRCALLVITFLTLTAARTPAETMYGSGSAQQDGEFGTVDQTTANFTVIGDPTPADGDGLSGIAFDAAGRVWGSVVNSNDRDSSRLIEINRVTGLLIRSVDNIRDGSDADVRIVDLAVQPSTNALFGIDYNGELYTINKQTAVATAVGNPLSGERGGIAFDRNGTLYLVPIGGGELWRVDPQTGNTIGMAVPLNGSGACLDGLGVRPIDGILFATECDGRDIVRIDPTTGDAVEIDPGDDEDDVADLAFPFGERQTAPTLSIAALVVLGAALLGVGLRASRGRRIV